jgi:hypothetical protein
VVLRRDEVVDRFLQGDDGGNTPRLRRRLASLANTVSTALSQEHEVGVKWKIQRGCRFFAHEASVRRVIDSVERPDPAWFHPMHGGSFTRALAPRFYRALRDEPFAYSGVLLGRQLVA